MTCRVIPIRLEILKRNLRNLGVDIENEFISRETVAQVCILSFRNLKVSSDEYEFFCSELNAF